MEYCRLSVIRSENMNRVLIISHNSSRSGAPVLLLNLAKLLQELKGFKTDFLLKKGGELETEFRKSGNVIILDRPPKNLVQKLIRKFLHGRPGVLSKIDYNNYDFILSNTILNGDILPFIRKKYRGPVISYIHELKVASEYLTTSETLANVTQNSDHFLVPSNAVKTFLLADCKVEEHKIHILPSYIPCSNAKSQNNKTTTTNFIIGACGTVELRKGTDLFIQVAKTFSDRFPDIPVKFIWKGADTNSLDYKFLAEDIKKLNLSSVCAFLPSSANMDDFYNELDVFVLTSREDPYPLVVLEAANASVPSICFRDSGGASEFIAGNGKLVDYMNIVDMAHALRDYYYDSEQKVLDGKNALLKLKKMHQDKELIVNKLLEPLQKLGGNAV